MDWTKEEVALIVADYFSMLMLELKGEDYVKSDHRKSLLPLLQNRSDGSIEFKHQNITAALMNMGLPYIKGYKAKPNYQRMLEDEIAAYIGKHQLPLEKNFDDFSTKTVDLPEKPIINFSTFLKEEPDPTAFAERSPTFLPIKTNYLEKEQRNRSLGMGGEKLVLEYERWRLINEGKENLVDKIEWMSETRGDGMGYDILSKNVDGTDRFIEVKTTKLSKEAPVFLTNNEIAFATIKQQHFYLYRVFDFEKSPGVFIKHGRYDNFCTLVPQTFRGYF